MEVCGGISIASLLLGSVGLMGFALGGSHSVAFFCYAMWSAFHTLTILNGITLRQQETPTSSKGASTRRAA